MRRLLAVAVALVLALAGCVSGDGDGASRSADVTRSGSRTSLRGGTLRTLSYTDPSSEAWDPLAEWGNVSFELHRCCLLRRLFSFSGKPADQGGTVVRPDLATRMPDVSDDGLTWTIEMKQGVRYAPPYEDREIVAADVVRALERVARSGTFWALYFSVIRGFTDYSDGDADAISGVTMPDAHTLVIHLVEPAGDLPGRLSISGTAPFPPDATRGHDDDYIRYLAASGPYMFAGADEQDPSLPPDEQPPVAGWTRDVVTLVRNPSWRPSTDDLRVAYPNRIRIDMMKDLGMMTRTKDKRLEEWSLRRMQEGRLDLLDDVPPWPATRRLVESGVVEGTMQENRTLALHYIPLNLAVPPFDDVHVRRAVNLAVDRTRYIQGLGKGLTSALALWHMVPGGLEGLRLDGWQPSWAEGVPPEGSLGSAHREMARSRYDIDGDGRCDGPGCTVRAATADLAVVTEPIVRAFRRLGIVLDYRDFSSAPDRWIEAFTTPALGYGFNFRLWWAPDFPNASSFFLPLLFGRSILDRGNSNAALLGASSEDLERWGFPVTSVPSIDDRIDRCMVATGQAQVDCWTALDQYTTENVVPWVPLAESVSICLVSSRVATFSFDASYGLPSYDRIALAPEDEG